jgi:4-hydroxy-tetrahydrodipicolinate synthase
MPDRKSYVPRGVIPACLLPFNDDLSIDEANFRRHLRELAGTEGVSAITVNGHSTEVSSCTLDEQKRVLDIALDEIGDRMPVINGVFAENTLEAGRIARWSEQAGAAALLVAPPSMFRDGAQHRPAMAFSHFGTVVGASDLPIILFQFQFQLASGLGFSVDTQMALADAFPTIRATKDACGDPVVLERTVRALQGRARPVHVLTTHSAWLYQSLAIGCDGLLSGAGSTVAPLQVALFEALRDNRLEEARRVQNKLWPITEAFYANPFVDMHNRMKEAQVLLGKMPSAVVRPPLVKLPAEEVARIRAGLVHAGLLRGESELAA